MSGIPSSKRETSITEVFDAADKTNYVWDASNRLVQITQTEGREVGSPSINASFSYDAFGRRIQSSIAKAGQAADTVQYIHEGSQALGEIRNGQLSHRLLTGLSLDETIARIASDGSKETVNSPVRGPIYFCIGLQPRWSVSITEGGQTLIAGSGAQGLVVQVSETYGNGRIGVTASTAVGANGTTSTVSPGAGTVGTTIEYK